MAILPLHAWLFIGAHHWQATLIVIALFAFAGAALRHFQTRIICFSVALLLSADVLLLFLLPGPE